MSLYSGDEDCGDEITSPDCELIFADCVDATGQGRLKDGGHTKASSSSGSSTRDMMVSEDTAAESSTPEAKTRSRALGRAWAAVGRG
jgi:hypothetical protein